MIRVVRGYDLTQFSGCAMFEDRRRVFVDRMRWDVPVVDRRFEIDQYDGPDALYIVESVADGGHLGSLRLLATTGPHILGNLFFGLVDGPVPVGADVHEITRLCVSPDLDRDARLACRNRLISAMVDHALASGITLLTGVVRPAFRDAILEMGWPGRALGPSRVVGGMALGAFAVTIAADTPARLAATGIYSPASAAKCS